MAIEKTIIIKADTSNAVKDVNNVKDSLKGVEKQAGKTSDKVEDVGKSAKKSKKGFSAMSIGIKGVGLALKAAGIGLVLTLLAQLTSVFSQNQKVVDKVNTVMTAMSIVFNQVFDVVSDVVSKVSEATDGFDAVGKVISGSLTIALTPLKLLFFSISLALQKAQLVWEESFFGDGDPETIKGLNKSILETEFSISKVVVAVVDAGKKIATNFVEAIGEFGTAIKVISTDGIDGIKNISVDAALAQAKAITEATKASAILELKQTRIREAADRDAELQRRIRDDFTKGIDERIEANNKLADILDVQEAAEKASVQARIDALNREQELLGFKQERHEEIFALNTELIAIEAQQAGFRAEQEINAINLIKEKADAKQKAIDDEIAAEQNLLSKLKEFRVLDAIEKLNEQEENAIKELELLNATEEQKQAVREFFNEKRKALEKSSLDNTKAGIESVMQLTSDVFSIADSLGKQDEKSKEKRAKASFAIQKTMNLGIAGINATQAILTSLRDSPIAVGAIPNPAGIASLAFASATGLATIAKIATAKFKGGISGGSKTSAPSGGGEASAPSFNLVQGTGSNQIAEGIQGQDPIQAFVVSSDVSTSQELDRNIVENASI